MEVEIGEGVEEGGEEALGVLMGFGLERGGEDLLL